MEMHQPRRSPESPHIDVDVVKLPAPMITYFRKTGRYMESLPAYEKIEGKNTNTDFPVNAYGVIDIQNYPVLHTNRKDLEYAIKKCKHMVGELYQKSNLEEIRILSRDYMTKGLTKPIRIEAVKGDFLHKMLYVKKPSIERIFGYLMYNLLSGFDATEFYFNETVFIEEEVKGRIPNEMTIGFLRDDDAFKESAIRLDVLNRFMMINDLDKRDNYILTSDNKVRAFDFDCMLLDLPGRKGVMDYLQDDEGFAFDRKFVKEVSVDEKMRLIKTIYNRRKCFDDIVKLMDSMDHFRKVAAIHSHKSCKKLFEDNIYRYLKN